MLEKPLLILITIIAFYFCYDLGYLLTGEFGLGQLFGVPFAFVLLILSLITMFAKPKLRSVFRIITTGYFLTMLTYTLTILSIKAINPAEYSEYLYYYADHKSHKILVWILLIGALLTLTTVLKVSQKSSSS